MNLAHLFAIANDELIEKRLELCNSCDKIKSNICIECGCIVKLKVKLNIAKCPLGKW